jgi:hypothetical protein
MFQKAIVNLTTNNATYTSAAGDYEINGLGGNNTITTGAGSSSVNTGVGNSTITTGAGNSIVQTGDGNQTITTGAGPSYVTTGVGNSTITTGAGNSTVWATGGNNTVTTGAGASQVTTGTGDDTITSGAGDAVVDSGTGNDTVTTGAGNDLVSYHVTGNASHHNMFTAAAGIDTLNLVMTRAEWMSDAVQTDVASYLSFLAANKGPSGENNATSYAFTAFGLTTSGFEKLHVQVDGVSVDPTNHSHPVAVDDLVAGSVTQVVSTLTFEDGTYSQDDRQYNHNTGEYDQTVTTGDFVLSGSYSYSSANNSYGAGPFVAPYWGADNSNVMYSYGQNANYKYDYYSGPTTTSPIAMTHTDGSSFSLSSANITSHQNYYSYGGSVYETVTGYSNGVQVAQQSFYAPDASNGSFNNLVTFTGPGFSSVDKVVFSLTKSNSNSGVKDSGYYYYNTAYQLIDNIGLSNTVTQPNTVAQSIDINVLANDTDVDSGAHLSVGSFSGFSAHGAAISLNANGTLHYNPTGSAELQALSQGTDVHDSFTYQAQDQFGTLSNQATVDIQVVGVAH